MTSAPPAAPAVDTSELSKAYFGVEALAPLDLRIESGERVSLIGHNGSGKSTLLKLLSGVLEPTAGTAQIAGHAIGSVEARAALSAVSDEPVFYDDLTVWEHLEYVARLHHTDDWTEHAAHLVDALGLAHRADDLPATFSRGLRQKAQLALAFVRPFEVLVVDEPFVGLDRLGRDALLELLAWAHGDGAAVVVATHELSSVSASDRLIALRDGQLVYDGDPADADVTELTAQHLDVLSVDVPEDASTEVRSDGEADVRSGGGVVDDHGPSRPSG